MIEAREFIEPARAAGYTWFAGVPCSYLTPFINFVMGATDLDYFAAANEGDAVAAAAGAWLGGRKSVVMMQNSGLGNAVSPLTSLNHVFGIPVLLICTQRGAPGVPDEPQHALMGAITQELLQVMRIPAEAFPTAREEITAVLARAEAAMSTSSRPYALVMPKGAVASHPLPATNQGQRPVTATLVNRGKAGIDLPSRAAALRAVIESTAAANTVVIATTGYAGRELYALADRPNHFYMVGSMGCASALGQGLALARPDVHVVVVDGDGAALMRMGNFATAGYYRPRNLSHLLLDNGVHDSTGGQSNASPAVDFPLLAAACGYGTSWQATGVDAIGDFLARPSADGAGFLHLRITPGTLDNLPRPAISPPEVASRFKQHLARPA